MRASRSPGSFRMVFPRSKEEIRSYAAAGHVIPFDRRTYAFHSNCFWEGCVSLLDHVYGTGEAVVHREPEGTEAHPVGRSYTIWPIRGPGYLLALSRCSFGRGPLYKNPTEPSRGRFMRPDYRCPSGRKTRRFPELIPQGWSRHTWGSGVNGNFLPTHRRNHPILQHSRT